MLFDIAYALQMARLIDFERLAFDADYRHTVLDSILYPATEEEEQLA